MRYFSCLNRDGSTPNGGSNVFFCFAPEDYDKYFHEISSEFLEIINCNIYYTRNIIKKSVDKDIYESLDRMNMIVFIVTNNLLEDKFKESKIFEYAKRKNIPVVPIAAEDFDREKKYKAFFGSTEYLNRFRNDKTAIPYKTKLRKNISDMLLDDELIEKVKEAFDTYIFLSYRKKDRSAANKLIKLIHQNELFDDVAIWFDEFLVPGEDYNNTIDDYLKQSKLFALAITPNLVNEKGNYVLKVEYPKAMEKDKSKILPLEAIKVDKEKYNESFSEIGDCVNPYNPEELSASLIEKLGERARDEKDASPEHKFFIGLAYLNGIDFEIDKEKALKFIEEAADTGLEEAVETLANVYCYENSGWFDFQKYTKWAEKLIEIRRDKFDKIRSEEQMNSDDTDYREAAESLCKVLIQYAVSCHKYYVNFGQNDIGYIDEMSIRIGECEEIYKKVNSKSIFEDILFAYNYLLEFFGCYEEEFNNKANEVIKKKVDLYKREIQRYESKAEKTSSDYLELAKLYSGLKSADTDEKAKDYSFKILELCDKTDGGAEVNNLKFDCYKWLAENENDTQKRCGFIDKIFEMEKENDYSDISRAKEIVSSLVTIYWEFGDGKKETQDYLSEILKRNDTTELYDFIYSEFTDRPEYHSSVQEKLETVNIMMSIFESYFDSKKTQNLLNIFNSLNLMKCKMDKVNKFLNPIYYKKYFCSTEERKQISDTLTFWEDVIIKNYKNTPYPYASEPSVNGKKTADETEDLILHIDYMISFGEYRRGSDSSVEFCEKGLEFCREYIKNSNANDIFRNMPERLKSIWDLLIECKQYKIAFEASDLYVDIMAERYKNVSDKFSTSENFGRTLADLKEIFNELFSQNEYERALKVFKPHAVVFAKAIEENAISRFEDLSLRSCIFKEIILFTNIDDGWKNRFREELKNSLVLINDYISKPEVLEKIHCSEPTPQQKLEHNLEQQLDDLSKAIDLSEIGDNNEKSFKKIYYDYLFEGNYSKVNEIDYSSTLDESYNEIFSFHYADNSTRIIHSVGEEIIQLYYAVKSEYDMQLMSGNPFAYWYFGVDVLPLSKFFSIDEITGYLTNYHKSSLDTTQLQRNCAFMHCRKSKSEGYFSGLCLSQKDELESRRNEMISAGKIINELLRQKKTARDRGTIILFFKRFVDKLVYLLEEDYDNSAEEYYYNLVELISEFGSERNSDNSFSSTDEESDDFSDEFETALKINRLFCDIAMIDGDEACCDTYILATTPDEKRKFSNIFKTIGALRLISSDCFGVSNSATLYYDSLMMVWQVFNVSCEIDLELYSQQPTEENKMNLLYSYYNIYNTYTYLSSFSENAPYRDYIMYKKGELIDELNEAVEFIKNNAPLKIGPECSKEDLQISFDIQLLLFDYDYFSLFEKDELNERAKNMTSLLERILELDRSNENLLSAAFSYGRMADKHAVCLNKEQEYEYCKKAFSLYKEISIESLDSFVLQKIFSVLNRIASCLTQDDRYTDAEGLVNQYMTELTQSDLSNENKTIVIREGNLILGICCMLNAFNEADVVEQKFQNLSYEKTQSRCNEILEKAGKTASGYFEKAIEVIDNKGPGLSVLNRVREAAERYHMEEFCREMERKTRCKTRTKKYILYNFIRFYLTEKNIDDAKRYAELFIQYVENPENKTEDPIRIDYCYKKEDVYILLGDIEKSRSDFKESLEYYQKALSCCDDPHKLYQIYKRLAEIAYNEGCMDKAKTYYEKADKNNDLSGFANKQNCWIKNARYFMSDFNNKVLNIYEEFYNFDYISALTDKVECLERLSEICQAQGNREEAENYRNQAAEKAALLKKFIGIHIDWINTNITLEEDDYFYFLNADDSDYILACDYNSDVENYYLYTIQNSFITAARAAKVCKKFYSECE